jgi:sigma-E factor negative regulatory protein RseA
MNDAAGQQPAPELGLDGAVGAFADGALSTDEAQHVLDVLLNTPALRATWDELHWVGDCLRSEETGAMTASADFMTRFGERLAAEPTVLAPGGGSARPKRWLRYAVPGAAAMAAVTMVVWIALPPSGNLVAESDPALATKASAPASVTAAPAAPIAAAPQPVDPAQLREYVMAHQEFGSTGLHGPVAIQAASFDIAANEGSKHP